MRTSLSQQYGTPVVLIIVLDFTLSDVFVTRAHGYAAHEASGEWKEVEFQLPPLGAGDVEIAVDACGVCHSDMSMLDNA